jgi:hypothetical protein
MNFSVTQNGKPLHPSKYNWNEKTKTFSTNTSEDNLVLDFNDIYGVTFKTGSNCTFKTGDNCTFNTGSHCTFNTGSECTFTTVHSCTFTTSWNCTFKTGDNCTFITGLGCTFTTGDNCTFTTDSDCTFNTGSNCVAIRYDVTGIIELPNRKTIKLNGYQIPGYTVVEPTHTITIDGKEITLSNESFNELKKQLCS